LEGQASSTTGQQIRTESEREGAKAGRPKPCARKGALKKKVMIGNLAFRTIYYQSLNELISLSLYVAIGVGSEVPLEDVFFSRRS
jgi:hypothetical protein